MIEQEPSSPPTHRAIRFLVSAAALVLVLWGINQAQAVLALVLVSGFLALLGTPPTLWLIGKRVPTGLAVLVVIAGIMGVIATVVVLLGLSLRSIITALPEYQDRLAYHATSVSALLARMGIEVEPKTLLGVVDAEALKGLGRGVAAGLTSAFSSVVLILLTVSFILLEASTFRGKLRVATHLPGAHYPEVDKFIEDLRRYVVTQTVVSLTAGVISGVWFAVLGVDFAILFGLLVWVLNYVPNVGSVLAILPVAVVAFIEFGPGRAALAVVGYVLVTFVLGNVVQPRLMGHKLGLSTLVVFLSVIFWGSLLGVTGMVLCVPLTMALKFALERSDSTRWIAVLLEREAPAASPQDTGPVPREPAPP